MKRVGFSAVCLMSAVLVLLFALELSAVPNTVSFQGVLRSSSGTPVPDGSYSATFSIWNDPTVGSQNWTETQTVTTTGGLFTVELGKLESLGRVFADNSDVQLYLQIQVMINGLPVVMSPRTALLSSPYSTTTTSVEGDFKTKPGTIVVRPPTGMSGSTTGTIRMQSTNDSSRVLVATDIDLDGHEDVSQSTITTPDSVVHELSLSSLLMPALMKAKEKANRTKCGSNLRCISNMGDINSESDLSCDLSGGHHILSGHSGSTTGTIRMQATPDSVVEASTMDNGISGSSSYRYLNNERCEWTIQCPDGDIKSIVAPTTSSVAINTKGTGADKNRCVTTVTADSASLGMAVLNGLPPGTPVIDNIRLRVDALSSSVAINTKGTGADKGRTAMGADQDSAYNYVDQDSDGDGLSDASITQTCTPTVTKLAIKTKGTSAHRSMHTVETDVDGDGVSDMSIESSTDHSGSSLRLNGLPPGEPVIGTLTLTTDGDSSKVTASSRFGNGPRQTTSMDGTFSHAKMRCMSDIDDDGHGDVGTECEAIENRSTLKTYFETGDIPTESRSSVTTTCDSSGSTFEMQSRLNGLPPGEPVIGTLSMTTSGSGADIAIGDPGVNGMTLTSTNGGAGTPGYSEFRMGRPAVNTATTHVDDVQGATISLAHTGSGPGDRPTSAQFGSLIDSYVHLMEDGVTRCALGSSSGLQLRDQFGNLRSSVSDGTGFFASKVGIGVDVPTHHIDVTGGAYCDGTNWVNASSKSLKENFKAVDGEEILEKVEELPITRWNYKSEDDNVTHIGPTAEDFREAFKVGETDKAISTIDPSGVALAAIKELAKKNKQLEKQNDELKKQLDDLQKAVAKLVKQNEKGQ